MIIREYTHQLTILTFLKETILIAALGHLARVLLLFFFRNEGLDEENYHTTAFLNSLPFVFGYSLMKALGTQKVKIIVDELENVDRMHTFVFEYLRNNDLDIIRSTEKKTVLAKRRTNGISKYLKRKEYYTVITEPTRLVITGPLDRISKKDILPGVDAH